MQNCFKKMDPHKQTMLQEQDNEGSSSGKMGAPLFGWPWQNLGSFKVCTSTLIIITILLLLLLF